MTSHSSATLISLVASLAVVLAVTVATSGVDAVRPQDEVMSLPNYNAPKLPSRQYSGFLEVDAVHGRNLHYWFVESQSNPATDPVILWMNGGPGCSSLDGYFYEHGPLHFGDGMTLKLNPWSWTRNASIIYLEAPAGVGFSFSKTISDYNTDDNQTAADNHKALQLFFADYPEFAKQDFYIAGESYAGIYVPTLARLVLHDPNMPQFKGVMSGNPVSDDFYDSTLESFLPIVANHGIISQETAASIATNCAADPNGAKCQAAEQKAYYNFQDINVYDMYLDCYTQRPAPAHLQRFGVGLGEQVPCIDSDKATDYLNQAAVKQAIHVTISPNTWAICSGAINYTSTWTTVLPVYQELVAAGKRVLIYSGDVDCAVPYVGTEKWTVAMANQANYSRDDNYKPWFVQKWDGRQVAGYQTSYTPPGGKPRAFSYVTVMGSGHMVPQFRPEAGYYMAFRWISGQPL